MYKKEMDSPLYEHLKRYEPVADANDAFNPSKCSGAKLEPNDTVLHVDGN